MICDQMFLFLSDILIMADGQDASSEWNNIEVDLEDGGMDFGDMPCVYATLNNYPYLRMCFKFSASVSDRKKYNLHAFRRSMTLMG